MILEVRRENEKRVMEISGTGYACSISIDGRHLVCDWMRLPDGHYSIIIDGRVFDLAVEAGEDGTFLVEGRDGKHRFQVRDPRNLVSLKTVEGGSTGLQRLRAEIPGKVIRVLARKGEAVAYDQPVLVVEAMKMQNEIRAPKAGVVKEIAVTEGRTVGSGEFLLSIE